MFEHLMARVHQQRFVSINLTPGREDRDIGRLSARQTLFRFLAQAIYRHRQVPRSVIPENRGLLHVIGLDLFDRVALFLLV